MEDQLTEAWSASAMPDVSSLVSPAIMRTLVESSLEGLAVFDPAGCWLYVNPAGCDILGLPADQVIGRRAFCTPSPAVPPTHEALEPVQVVSATTLERPDGETRRVEYVATPFRSRDEWYTAVSFRDLTALLRERRRLSAFSHAAHSIAYRGSLREILDAVAEQVFQAADLAMAQILISDPSDLGAPIAVYGAAGETTLPRDFSARAGQVRANGGEWLSSTVMQTRQPILRRRRRQVILADPAWSPLHDFFGSFQWADMVAIPLMVGDRPLGSFNAYFHPHAAPGSADLAFLQSMADQTAIAIESARLFAESRGRAAMDERHRIARDLHDTVSQHLFSVGLHGRTAQLAADGDDEPRREVLDHNLRAVIELSETALDEMRDFVFALHPTSLSELGLASAVRQHAAAMAARERLPVVVDAADDDPPDLDPTEAEDAYRIVVEALHNVVKHAGATTCRVRIGRAPDDDGALVLEISDDGRGIHACTPRDGSFGLRSMRERAQRLGGDLEVTSAPEQGTLVRAVVPRKYRPDAHRSSAVIADVEPGDGHG